MDVTCDGCVVCEVDGQPIDPVWFAGRQERERQGREAVETLLAALSAPLRPRVAHVPAPRLTSRQRGALRRLEADAKDNAGAIGEVGIVLSDRRHVKSGHRGSRSRK